MPGTVGRRRVWSFHVPAAGLLVLLVACGSERADRAELAEPRPAETFRLGHLPAGADYELTVAAPGSRHPLWGDDMLGADEPVLVLGEGGDDERVVVVAATGYAGYEGGFEQGSASYLSSNRDEVRVDGRRAIYTAGRETGDEVLVDLGAGRAVRVSSDDVDRETILAVAERATVDDGPDGTTVPVVEDPPGELEVLGGAGIDLVVGLSEFAIPPPRSELVPGTERSYTVGYQASGGEGAPWVLVMSVPGSADDLVAARSVNLHGTTEADDVRVAGRRGVVFTTTYESSDERHRRLLTTGPNGSLLVVTAGPQLPVDELVAVAAGVEPVDATAWTQQEEEAGGGAGLRPDEGAVVVQQGTVGGVGWLLQAIPRAEVGTSFPIAPGLVQSGPLVVDPCPKLADGRRPCGVSARTGPEGLVYSVRDRSAGGGEGLTFVVGVVPGDVVRVRASGLDLETVPVPQGDVRTFVVPVEAGRSEPVGIEAVHSDGSVTALP